MFVLARIETNWFHEYFCNKIPLRRGGLGTSREERAELLDHRSYLPTARIHAGGRLNFFFTT